MFSGQYADALQQLETYVAAESDPKPEFILKAWALKGLQQMLKVGCQARREKLALELAAPTGALSGPELKKQFEEALQLDALCGLAWFNLGSVLNRQCQRDDACIAYLWAALVYPKDAQAWANAFALAVSSQQNSMLAPHIAFAGRLASGNAMIEQLLKIADSQPAEFPKQVFLSLVDKILIGVPEEQRPFELRLLDDDGRVHSVPLNQA
jgi:tetratricopeptide (TPR) repeat protein